MILLMCKLLGQAIGIGPDIIDTLECAGPRTSMCDCPQQVSNDITAAGQGGYLGYMRGALPVDTPVPSAECP